MIMMTILKDYDGDNRHDGDDDHDANDHKDDHGRLCLKCLKYCDKR